MEILLDSFILVEEVFDTLILRKLFEEAGVVKSPSSHYLKGRNKHVIESRRSKIGNISLMEAAEQKYA